MTTSPAQPVLKAYEGGVRLHPTVALELPSGRLNHVEVATEELDDFEFAAGEKAAERVVQLAGGAFGAVLELLEILKQQVDSASLAQETTELSVALALTAGGDLKILKGEAEATIQLHMQWGQPNDT